MLLRKCFAAVYIQLLLCWASLAARHAFRIQAFKRKRRRQALRLVEVSHKSDQEKKAKADAASDKKRIKELEREIARKDKALAEAAALLVLGKKLSTLRQDDGED